MTNAERIRNMTDEELAELLPSGDCFCCPVQTEYAYMPEDCDHCALRWLRQECENNG